MKKFIFGILVVCAVASCLGEAVNSRSYTLDVTFEDPNESVVKFDKDSLSTLNEYGIIMWLDPSLALLYKQKDNVFQGGFRLSRLKGEANGKLSKLPTDLDAWRVNASGGALERYTGVPSATYAVFYDNPAPGQMPDHDVEFGYKDIGSCAMSGCYVNNTTLVARKVKEVFEDGDKLILRAAGYMKDGTPTGKSEIVLAEYSALKDTVMYNWTPFDLSKFGAVDFIDFEVVSTKPEVPGYACIDGILANIAISY